MSSVAKAGGERAGWDLTSNAANGSLVAPRIGDGEGLVVVAGAAVGLPRRMGTTSGIYCFVGCGGEYTAPTVGGDFASGKEGNC